MIQLPRFTFLCGPAGSGQVELIRALCNQDEYLLRLDFTSLLHDLIHQLFPDSFPITKDPLEVPDNSVMGYPVSQAPDDEYVSISSVTVRQLYHGFEDSLRGLFGPNFLGLMAYRYYVSHGIKDIFQRVIYSDTPSCEDAEVFLKAFGPESCLFIHLGSLTEQRGTCELPGKHLWLAMRETPSRLRQLEIDLGPNKRKSA